LLQKAAGFGGLFACSWGNLDRTRRAAYIARQDDKNDDACCSNEPPPPPYCHGTGALSRINRFPCRRDFGRGTSSFSMPALLALVR
jgi:hypothetical protein